jgi:plastocyanin
MNRAYHLLLAIVGFGLTTTQAVTHNILIDGTSYSPDVVNAVVGDEIVINATSNHPVAEVEESTWDADGNTVWAGGFGTSTSNVVFTVTTPGTIYYVCLNHVSCCSMKGLINITLATGISDATSITSLQVYPTLVTDGLFSVTGNDEELNGSWLEIYNMNGQLVERFNVDGNKTEFLVNLSSGTYSSVIVKNNKVVLRERMVFVNK